MKHESGISAECIAASEYAGTKLYTLITRAPKSITDAEFEKHRMLSSNSSSSRAIPLSRTIDRVLGDPFVPFDVRRNQRGMQGDERLEGSELAGFQQAWRDRAAATAVYANCLHDEFNVHKQTLNRLLEPFVWQQKVVTATEWDNFFALRLHPAAQPEMRILAECMREAIDRADVIELDDDDWHIPFERPGEEAMSLYERLMISAARCARISYSNHGRTDISYDADISLAERLLDDGHCTPFEHQATPLHRWEERSHTDRAGRLWSGNFRNWVQFRKLIERV